MVFPKLPDPYPNAIRVALAVFTATAIGYGIVLPEHGVHTTYARQFSQASKWAAITCVVVNAPVIGKIAQTGAERILGSVAGGTLGYVVYEVGHRLWDPDTRTDGITLSIAAAMVAFSGIVVGKALNLAYSAKLYAIAFLIVTFGAVDEESTDTSVFLLAAMRVTGIASGVLLTELYAVLIFPKSATQEAVAKMKTAMQKLGNLNKLVWEHGPWSPPQNFTAGVPRRVDGYAAISDKEESLEDLLKRQESFEEQSEKVLMEVYDALYKVEEQVPLAAAEIYLRTWRGTLIFLPGLPWFPMGRWHLPAKQMDALATSLRKVARLLWALHLSFLDGFDENMLNLLKQQYPSQLMPQLAEHSQGALDAAAAAFPSSPRVDKTNLQLLVNSVEGLMRISDFQRRRILQLIKHFRVASTARRTLARAFSARRAAGSSADAGSPLRFTASMPEPSTLPIMRQEQDVEQGVSAPARDLGAYSRARPAALPRVPEQRHGNAAAHADVMDGSNTEEMMLGGSEDEQQGLAHRGRQSSSLTEALLAAEVSPHSEDALTTQVASEPVQRRPTSLQDLDWTLNRSYVGTPVEALGDLPDGLRIAMGEADDSASAQELPSQVDGAKGRDFKRLLTMRLQRVESSELIEFPENEEGYLGKIRWYSFQFLMQELAEELEDMYEALDDVLAVLKVAMGS
ncbi:g1696 [Coccomyxa elongata]